MTLMIGTVPVVEQVWTSTVHDGKSSTDCYFKRTSASTTEKLVFRNEGLDTTIIIDCPDIVHVTMSRGDRTITTVFGYTDVPSFYGDVSELRCPVFKSILSGMLYKVLHGLDGETGDDL